MIFRKKGICLLLVSALCAGLVPGAVFAEETDPGEILAGPVEETTEPTEETTEPTEETTEPTEETTEPTEETTEPTEETTEPTESAEELPKGWGLYFGQLHSHSTVSDGKASVEELYAQAAGAGLDFFAVTDRGESIAGADSASLSQDMTELSPDWAEGKTAAAGATNRDFVGIYGFEMTWPREKAVGHIVTMNTPGFASWQQQVFSEAGSGLEAYGAALGAVPDSVSQFCHPGPESGDFRGFTQYSAGLDRVVQLLEVGTGKDAYRYYTQALDHGWHVAPTCNQTNQYGIWADFSVGRTVVQGETLTEKGIFDAIRNYRVYAAGDEDLHIYFDQMGARLARRNVGREVTLTVRVFDPTDPVGRVEVIGNGGQVIDAEAVAGCSGELSFVLPADYDYYYLKITQPDGDTAVTAPVWLEGEADVGISAFVCGTELPVQGSPLELKLVLKMEIPRICWWNRWISPSMGRYFTPPGRWGRFPPERNRCMRSHRHFISWGLRRSPQR